MFKKIFTVCCILALLVSLSTAQGEEKKAVEMEEMVVTATRTPEKKEILPPVVIVVSKEDIERTVATDLTDILKKTSGVDVIQYPGALSGIGIRGFTPEYSGTTKHSLLLIDGRPAGATNLATIPMDNIERIEVLKGPASSLYGSEAMGGVVNIITKKSSGKIKTALTMGGGSFDTWNAKVATGGGITNKFDFDFNASTHNQNDDLRMGDGHKREHTAFKKHYGAMRVGSAFTENWRMDMKGDWYAGRDIETPGDIAYGTTRQSSKDIDRYGGDIKISGSIGDNNKVSLTFFRSREESEHRKEEAGITPHKSYVGTIDWIGGQSSRIPTASVHTV